MYTSVKKSFSVIVLHLRINNELKLRGFDVSGFPGTSNRFHIRVVCVLRLFIVFLKHVLCLFYRKDFKLAIKENN